MPADKDQINLFNEKLQKYEENIIEFLLDISQQKRVNPKISIIASYLLIYESLTQKDLKNLTGFSMGTISTYLSVMTGTGTIQKQIIPKTHMFKYSFYGNLGDFTTRGLEVALNSFVSLESYFKNKHVQLERFAEQSKKGAKHLSERLDGFSNIFKFYKLMFNILVEDLIEQDQIETALELFNQTKNVEERVSEISFAPEVYAIEDDILNQLLTTPMFLTKDTLFVKILGLFITRKYLTQKTLKRITGLSSGKISQEVNQLLEDNLIEKAKISDKGKITYGAISADLLLLKFSRSIISRTVKWEKELQKMKQEMEDNKFHLEKLRGYERISQIYTYFIDIISKYKKCLSLIDNIIEASK